MKLKTILLIFAFFLFIAPSAQAEFSFDDIDFWAGSGSNKAGMIVHWSAPEVYNKTSVPAPIADVSYAWGFQFDGAVTGWDMMTGLAAVDPRLYVVGGSGTVQGIGYDLDGDGEYGISNGTTTYTQDNFTGGVLGGLGYAVDNYAPTDDGDLFWIGWMGPNWELWHEDGGDGGFTDIAPDRGTDEYWTDAGGWVGSHGEWDFSQVGINGISLEDGSWVGWSVSAGGLEWGTPDAPGTIAWNEHKQAPMAPVPVPAAVWLLCSVLPGLICIRKRWS